MQIDLRKVFAYLAVAFLAFFAIASYALEGMQQIALWVAVPAATVLSFMMDPRLKFNVYMKLQLALYLWIAFTAVFALYPGIADAQVRRIVVCFMSIFSFNQLARRPGLTKWLYLVYIIFYLSMLYYAGTHILVDDYDYSEDRLDDDKLNANMIAYFTFFTTYIIYIMAEMVEIKWLKLLFTILFLISPAWSFAVAILTGSRQVIVIQAPLIAFLFYIRYLKGKTTFRKGLFIVLGIILLFILANRGMRYYEGSYLSYRNEESYLQDSRIKMIMDAADVGFSHPLVGVGPGCFGRYRYGRSFSHCNYVELFANSGLLAMILCFVLYGTFIKRQWQRFRRTRDPIILVFFVFGVMYALDNVFYVYYINPWLMSFFFLVAVHSDMYFQEKYPEGLPRKKQIVRFV